MKMENFDENSGKKVKKTNVVFEKTSFIRKFVKNFVEFRFYEKIKNALN